MDIMIIMLVENKMWYYGLEMLKDRINHSVMIKTNLCMIDLKFL